MGRRGKARVVGLDRSLTIMLEGLSALSSSAIADPPSENDDAITAGMNEPVETRGLSLPTGRG
jgi:hypothetical protein